MSKLPPDWKDDERLWDTLGKLPQTPAPTNFAYKIRQKLAGEPQTKRRKSWFSSLHWIFRGAGIAAFCGLVLFVSLNISHRSEPVPVPEWATSSSMLQGETSDPKIELAALAEDYELIQDLDVIQNLDQL